MAIFRHYRTSYVNFNINSDNIRLSMCIITIVRLFEI